MKYKSLLKKVVTEVNYIPNVVNHLTVAFNNAGKPRIVLDCRHINQCIHNFSFRSVDTKSARDIFDKGDYLFSFDLKSAYHRRNV